MLKVAMIGVATVAAGGTAALVWGDVSDEARYVTAAAETGALVASVAVSGRVVPVLQVEVGSGLSGQIEEILVDFNSPVEKGQAIARLDPQASDAQLRQAEAPDPRAATASATCPPTPRRPAGTPRSTVSAAGGG